MQSRKPFAFELIQTEARRTLFATLVGLALFYLMLDSLLPALATGSNKAQLLLSAGSVLCIYMGTRIKALFDQIYEWNFPAFNRHQKGNKQ